MTKTKKKTRKLIENERGVTKTIIKREKGD